MKFLKILLLISAGVTVILRLFAYQNGNYLEPQIISVINVICIVSAIICILCALIWILILKKQEKAEKDKHNNE